MKEYIKNIFSGKKTVSLILIGLAATAFSFVYPSVSEYRDDALMLVIAVVDLILLFVNAREFSSLWTVEKENSKILNIVNALLITVMYFCLFIIISAAIYEDLLTVEYITGVLALALYIGPSLLIVLPILYGILYIFG